MTRARPALRHHIAPGAVIPRHLHDAAYAAVVLSGGYEEAGERGRWRVQAGDVLIHGRFSGHQDRVPGRRVEVLNLPLPDGVDAPAMARAADPDLLARLAEYDPREAAHTLLDMLSPAGGAVTDAPDLLAQALSGEAPPGVEAWARGHGVSRETAFRWFRDAYGVAPVRFRLEARARHAWRMIVGEATPLAAIAAEAGYADQAHMNRDVRGLTGRAPGAWRTESRLQHSFKTQAA